MNIDHGAVTTRGTPRRMRPFTDDEIAKINAMASEGATVAAIARALDRNQPSVRGVLKRGQTEAKPVAMTRERMDLAAVLWSQDVPKDEVRRRLNELPGKPIPNTKKGSALIRKMARMAGGIRSEKFMRPADRPNDKWTPERIKRLHEVGSREWRVAAVLAAINELPGKPLSSESRITHAFKRFGVTRPERPIVPPKPRKPREAQEPRAPRDDGWSDEQTALLLANDRIKTLRELGEITGHKLRDVWSKRRRLGLGPKVTARGVETFEPPPIQEKTQPRYAGWREISDWWFAQTGKREWAPNLSEVNARRREQGRPPFAVMRAGQFVIPMMRAS